MCTRVQSLLPSLCSALVCRRHSCACCHWTAPALLMAGRSQPFVHITALVASCSSSSSWGRRVAQDTCTLATCVTTLRWQLTLRSSAAGSQTSCTWTQPTRARSKSQWEAQGMWEQSVLLTNGGGALTQWCRYSFPPRARAVEWIAGAASAAADSDYVASAWCAAIITCCWQQLV